jgi:hypothetical protein
MISAKRFTFFDRETDVPVSDFEDIQSSEIFNSPNSIDIPLTADVLEFLNNDVQISEIFIPEIKDPSVRSSKGSLGSLKDIAKLSDRDLDKEISKLLPKNPLAQSAFSSLSAKCKTKGISNLNLGKPYNANLDCGGKKRIGNGSGDGCSPSGFNDVLNKLTDGKYGGTFNDLNSSLKNLVGLSKFGYSMNMCGVFSALSGDINKNVLSRASGSLLGSLGNSGNVFGIMDLAGSSSGLHSLLENPSGIKNAFNGFKLPTEVKQSDFSSFGDRFMGSMELFDP